LYSHEFPPGYIDLYSYELNVLNVSNFILFQNQEKCKPGSKIKYLTTARTSQVLFGSGLSGKFQIPNSKFQTPEAMKIIKSFCRGSRGTVFTKRVPLAAGGKLFS
jgi:hypothetical protein